MTEDVGRFLAAALAGRTADGRGVPTTDCDWDDLALESVRAQRAAGRYLPGLGHNVYRAGDPQTPALLRIAAEEGLRGPHLRLFKAVGRVHPDVLGRTLPLKCGCVWRGAHAQRRSGDRHPAGATST